MSDLKIRDDVLKFALLMSDVLNKNEYKGGWENDTTAQLFNKMILCVDSFRIAYIESIRTDENKYHINIMKKQAVNISNYCLMINEHLNK